LQPKDDQGNQSEEDSEWEYVEDGPAEIIWKGNEIIVKKKKVKVPKGSKEKLPVQEVTISIRYKFLSVLFLMAAYGSFFLTYCR
jgi:hypothetical protein